MRTTLTIDDELFVKAVALAEPGMDKADLLKECVRAFIQRQSASSFLVGGAVLWI